MYTIKGKHRGIHGWEKNYFFDFRLMKKPNKKRNPVARQLKNYKKQVIKSKKIYDRKKLNGVYW